MHAYNNILVREHQRISKETCLLLTLTQFSPQAPNVTNSLYQYIFSETVYACACVCVHKWQRIFMLFCRVDTWSWAVCALYKGTQWKGHGPWNSAQASPASCLLCGFPKYILKTESCLQISANAAWRLSVILLCIFISFLIFTLLWNIFVVSFTLHSYKKGFALKIHI